MAPPYCIGCELALQLRWRTTALSRDIELTRRLCAQVIVGLLVGVIIAAIAGASGPKYITRQGVCRAWHHLPLGAPACSASLFCLCSSVSFALLCRVCALPWCVVW
jgi:hypothetical protein